MATLQKLKAQIEDANAVGRQHLTNKGVVVSGDSTTYEIMQKIAEIASGGEISGGGVEYSNITYNDAPQSGFSIICFSQALLRVAIPNIKKTNALCTA